MGDAHRSFIGPKFRSRARFEEAIRQYYREVEVDDPWRPEADPGDVEAEAHADGVGDGA